MSRGQILLVAHAAALVALLFLAVPRLTHVLGGPAGWLATMALYWVLFCIPVIAIHLGREGLSRLTGIALARNERWVPLLLGLQVLLVAIGTIVSLEAPLVVGAVGLAVLVALINGPLEEAAWRGGFLAVFAENRRLGFCLGLGLFTAWHVPLALAHGIDYGPGGAFALVGGAALLGLVWSVVVWRTGSIFWVSLAHVATNVFAFAVLFSSNAFV